MKKIFLAIIAMTALAFSSCSNKVDLYSDDVETTIVYGMLDAGLDTNYFKITKSFVGNANEMAHNYAANNYTANELEVTLRGKFDDGHTETVRLDTIAIWIPYDANATFYSGCWQTYYYLETTGSHKLAAGTEYTINVLRKADSLNMTAKTKTINSFEFKTPMASQELAFKDVKKGKVEWRVRDPNTHFQSTAAYFEVTGYFHYSEKQPGSSSFEQRSIKWHLGEGKAEDLFATVNNDSYYVLNYVPENLYTILANDNYLNNNSPTGVERRFGKFEIVISAIGEELYNYYVIANSSSAIQDVPNYTNVTNGKGIVSSRISKNRENTIKEDTRKDIVATFPKYGFVNQTN